jgi:RNA methyltransferase, TrmH family
MITSKSNETIRLVRALQSQRKTRERERLFVAEGIRLVEEALESSSAVRWVLHSGRLGPRERSVVNRLARAGAAVEEVDPPLLYACSDTVTPQDVLAVVAWPELPLPDPLEWTLVADGISNPGNLGSLLRAAEAFGVQAALLAPGCVDAFNPKVVRGAMGALLRLPLREAGWQEMEGWLAGVRVLAAAAREGAPAAQADWSGRVALVLGGEASGVGPQARALAAGFVHIPMRRDSESLNAAVAGGILMYEAARSRGVGGATA